MFDDLKSLLTLLGCGWPPRGLARQREDAASNVTPTKVVLMTSPFDLGRRTACGSAASEASPLQPRVRRRPDFQRAAHRLNATPRAITNGNAARKIRTKRHQIKLLPCARQSAWYSRSWRQCSAEKNTTRAPKRGVAPRSGKCGPITKKEMTTTLLTHARTRAQKTRTTPPNRYSRKSPNALRLSGERSVAERVR